MRRGDCGVFVRIRIFRIGGIFRISLAYLAVFAMIGIHNETNAYERLPIENAPDES